jgi:hypothetical protein
VQVNTIVLSHYSRFKGNNLYLCCGFYRDAANDIIIGRYSRSNYEDDDSETIDIEEKVLYPRYHSQLFSNDLMIMKLKQKSTKPFVKLSQYSPEDGEELTVIGFGDTMTGSALVIPTELNEVQLNYVNNDDCQDMHGSSSISDDMMCALEKNKDSWYVRFPTWSE